MTFNHLVVLIINTLKRSLSIEIQQFFEYLSSEASCTKQAFSKQRGKLKAAFFHDWNTVLVESFYQHYGTEARRWKGLRMVALDGSTVPLPIKEDLKEYFGCPSNGKGDTSYPVARISVLYDVLNQIALNGFIYLRRIGKFILHR